MCPASYNPDKKGSHYTSSSSSSNNKHNHHHQQQQHATCTDPVALTPLWPVRTVHRERRLVRTRNKTEPHMRHVLEPTLPPAGGAMEGLCVSYVMDSLLNEAPKKGVALFLATPLVPSTEAGAAATPCLVSCGGPVVIKAVRHPNKNHKASSRGGPAAADDPFLEIGAMQQLMQHSPSSYPPHPHVIHLLDCMQDQDFVYMVLPYLPGDLFSQVEKSCGKGLPEEQARNYFRQMCEGLLFMKNTCHLAHHDVSVENVMVDNQDHAKIIDMGMCLQVPTQPSNQGQDRRPVYLHPRTACGKRTYIAPEVVHELACDPFASDIWSLGVSLYILLTGRPLYGSPTDPAFDLLAQGKALDVLNAYENYGAKLSPTAKDLVCHMLSADPTKRPTLEEVLAHPFLWEICSIQDIMDISPMSC